MGFIILEKLDSALTREMRNWFIILEKIYFRFIFLEKLDWGFLEKIELDFTFLEKIDFPIFSLRKNEFHLRRLRSLVHYDVMIGIIMLHVGTPKTLYQYFFRDLLDHINIILCFSRGFSFNAWSNAKYANCSRFR